MSNIERNEPYVYQPFEIQDKGAWVAQRIYGISGVSMVTTINGLTKPEAEAVLAALKTFNSPPKDEAQTAPKKEKQ